MTFIFNIIISLIALFKTIHSITYEGECFCTKTPAIIKTCDVYYETIEYFPQEDITRTLTFCLNDDTPTYNKRLLLSLKRPSISSSSSSLPYPHIITDLDYIGDCSCYRLEIKDPKACNLFLITNFNNHSQDKLKACLVIIPTPMTTNAPIVTGTFPKTNSTSFHTTTTTVSTSNAFIIKVNILIVIIIS